MNVVFSRDWKIQHPGEWDGIWELVFQGEVASVVSQQGRGQKTVSNNIIKAIG